MFTSYSLTKVTKMFNPRIMRFSKALSSFTAKRISLPHQQCISTLDKKSTNSESSKIFSSCQTTWINFSNRNYSTSVTEGGNFVSSVEGGLRTITISRENVANSLTVPMFFEFSDALKEAAEDPNTIITAITGKGKFYSAGFDLVHFGKEPTVEGAEILYRGLIGLNADIIDFPKPLIALVNGSAAGIVVAHLGLMDAVYASDKASFFTPYSSLGIVSEGCASFTFPLIMGRGMATEMLMFNRKLNASEAQQCGLITGVYPADSFQEQVNKKLLALAKLPKKSLQYSKSLITHAHRGILHEISEMESRRIQECALSPEFLTAIQKFTLPSKKK